VVTVATTSIGTLSILGGLNVVVALELIGLVLNMFYTLTFIGPSPYLWSLGKIKKFQLFDKKTTKFVPKKSLMLMQSLSF